MQNLCLTEKRQFQILAFSDLFVQRPHSAFEELKNSKLFPLLKTEDFTHAFPPAAGTARNTLEKDLRVFESEKKQ